MLFYTHALRFRQIGRGRRRDNLLILWADEAQRFVTAMATQMILPRSMSAKSNVFPPAQKTFAMSGVMNARR
jgi:hypothetical protein